jgi:hypothetical protein
MWLAYSVQSLIDVTARCDTERHANLRLKVMLGMMLLQSFVDAWVPSANVVARG